MLTIPLLTAALASPIPLVPGTWWEYRESYTERKGEIDSTSDDITRFEYLKKSARNFGSVLLGIETSARDNFETLEARMTGAGFTYLDITDDAVITSLIV